MKQFMTRGSLLTLMAGGAIGVVFCLGIAIGSGLRTTGQASPADDHSDSQRVLTPEMILQAEASASGEKIGLTTGLADNATEALFALDYTTGDLYCWVLNPKAGAGFQAQYIVNVQEALEIQKGEPADYVMTTGRIDNSGIPSVGNARPAESVCYVADGNTGRVAGFSYLYNRAAASYGRVQEGELTVVCTGKTRGNIQRE